MSDIAEAIKGERVFSDKQVYKLEACLFFSISA